MDFKGCKNVVLDLGGVIINLNQDKTYKAFQTLFPIEFKELHSKLKTSNWLERFEVGEFSSIEFLSWFKQFDDEVTNQQLTNAWNSMLLNIPNERIELIKSLSRTHTIYLLSNTNDIHYQFIHKYVTKNFDGLDFNSLFKKVYLSHEIKLRKPNKAIFEHVLNDSNLKAKETFFIDDSEEHVLSAKQLGIKTHHLNIKQNQTLIHLFDEH